MKLRSWRLLSGSGRTVGRPGQGLSRRTQSGRPFWTSASRVVRPLAVRRGRFSDLESVRVVATSLDADHDDLLRHEGAKWRIVAVAVSGRRRAVRSVRPRGRRRRIPIVIASFDSAVEALARAAQVRRTPRRVSARVVSPSLGTRPPHPAADVHLDRATCKQLRRALGHASGRTRRLEDDDGRLRPAPAACVQPGAWDACAAASRTILLTFWRCSRPSRRLQKRYASGSVGGPTRRSAST
jgi:hypothetical protein